MTFISIYYADIREMEDDGLYSAAFSLASDERKERIRKYPSGKDRRLSLAAELLLKKALLGRNLPFDDLHYEYGKYGKPVLKGIPDIHFSISHSGNYALTAVSDHEIGCDIELIRPMDLSVARRFFHPEEYAHLCAAAPEAQTELFFRYWTLKESFLKITGMGLRLPMNAFRIDLSGSGIRIFQTADQNHYRFHEPAVSAGYRCAVCSEADITPGLFREDLRALTDQLSAHRI